VLAFGCLTDEHAAKRTEMHERLLPESQFDVTNYRWPPAACRPLSLQVVRCGRAIEMYRSSVLVRDFGMEFQPNMQKLA
jgi:hypothetical protein